MPRLKGSKNKAAQPSEPESTVKAIRETEAALQTNQEELNRLLAAIESQKKEYQLKKKEQKSLTTKLNTLRDKEAEENANRAAEARRTEAASLVERLLSSGKTAEEILSLIGQT